jgi:hypothetical protein
MSNSGSARTASVTLMRWVARFLSIAWAFWALFWTWFLAANYQREGYFGLAGSIIIMIIAALMFLGPAIITSVWRMEALGGGALLVDSVLVTLAGTLAPHEPMLTHEFRSTALGFLTMVLPPLAAGILFLVCHRRSRTSGEQHV